jgi:hypothetical protein
VDYLFNIFPITLVMLSSASSSSFFRFLISAFNLAGRFVYASMKSCGVTPR